MFPSNSPFLRHVLISTGKKDWVKDVASVRGSLAQLFEGFVEDEEKNQSKKREETEEQSGEVDETSLQPDLPQGCWQTTTRRTAPTRLFIGNASHISSSSTENGNSVMLFPDYVLVSDVPDAMVIDEKEANTETARRAFDRFISHRASHASSNDIVPNGPTPRRWVLPHRAIIILCSHHKRDARCGIAAPMLAEVFRRYAESYGWEVDERGEHDNHADSQNELIWDETLPIVRNKGWGYIDESSTTTTHSVYAQQQAWKKLASNSNSSHSLKPSTPSLGIFYCSHIGKHKYSGNVIVYLPNGAGVWYGRVDPLDGAGRVFEQTILQGKVIPEYLRAGINLYRGQQKVSGSKAEMNGVGQEGILRW